MVASGLRKRGVKTRAVGSKEGHELKYGKENYA
jgi:hypothetical protein